MLLDNELSLNGNNLPISQNPHSVNQQGEQNIIAQNVQNLIFNRVVQNKSNLPFDLRTLDYDYYHLIVTDQAMSVGTMEIFIPIQNALLKPWTSILLSNEFATLNEQAISQMKNYPSLLMPKSTGYKAQFAENECGYIGVLEQIIVNESGVFLHWRSELQFPFSLDSILNAHESIGLKGMDKYITEVNEVHWAIKNNDIRPLIQTQMEAQLDYFRKELP